MVEAVASLLCRLFGQPSSLRSSAGNSPGSRGWACRLTYISHGDINISISRGLCLNYAREHRMRRGKNSPVGLIPFAKSSGSEPWLGRAEQRCASPRHTRRCCRMRNVLRVNSGELGQVMETEKGSAKEDR